MLDHNDLMPMAIRLAVKAAFIVHLQDVYFPSPSQGISVHQFLTAYLLTLFMAIVIFCICLQTVFVQLFKTTAFKSSLKMMTNLTYLL